MFNIKVNFKAVIVWHWHKGRQKDKRKKFKSPEIFSTCFTAKGPVQCWKGQDFSLNDGEPVRYEKKKDLEPYFTLY